MFRLSFPVILCFACLAAAAQQPFSYETAWREVDSLLQKRALPKTAALRVNEIYARAAREGDEPQLLRALIYRTSGNSDDSAAIAGNSELADGGGTRSPAARAVLSGLRAELLWNYFQRNNWHFRDRHTIRGAPSADISTWSADNFIDTVSRLFGESLRPAAAIRAIPVADYSAILIPGNARLLRPTLYDLLAWQAIDFFSATYFPSATEAAKATAHATALVILDSVVAFHRDDPAPDARIDAEIRRIVFLYENTSGPDKDSAYLRSLRGIAGRYPGNRIAATAAYRIAAWWADRAARYSPSGDTGTRYDYLPARKLCEEILAGPDSSEGKANAKNLLAEIDAQRLQLRVESVNLPGEPVRVLAEYKNVATAQLRVLRMDRAAWQSARQDWRSLWTQLRKTKIFRATKIGLPDTRDYQIHRVEFLLDSLPPGYYLILSSTDAEFAGNSSLSASATTVSRIAVVSADHAFFALDRASGQPLAGISAQTRYEKDAGTEATGTTVRTDAHGMAIIDADPVAGRSLAGIEWKMGGDHFFYETSYGQFREDDREQEPDSDHRFFLLTDRGLYRPGQTVQWKAVAISADRHAPSPAAGLRTKFYLIDANDEPVDSAEATLSDFGSTHGSFRLPAGSLDGEFSIREAATATSVAFSVEEYKRPRFETVFDTLPGGYRLGDSVTITGHARGYAGYAVGGAAISYTVVRRTFFPYFGWGKIRPSQRDLQIAQGTSTTDSRGVFQIRLCLTPDSATPKNFSPRFGYDIRAEVTDESGETRSATQTLEAAYEAFQIQSNLGKELTLAADSLVQIRAHVENLSGATVPQPLTLTLTPLVAPDRRIRARYWEAPDQFLVPESEWRKRVPHDEYRRETDKTTWPRGKPIFSQTKIPGPGGLLLTPGKTPALRSGWYVLTLSVRDSSGTVSSDEHLLYIPGEAASAVYDPTPSDFANAAPGARVPVSFASGAKDVFLIRRLDTALRKPGAGPFEFISVSAGAATRPVEAADTSATLTLAEDIFVKDNRVYSDAHYIHFLHPERELTLQVASYRDKTMPGAKETWRVRITGAGRSAAAELATTLYDASLDAFRPFQWPVPDVWPSVFPNPRWNKQEGFSAVWPDVHDADLPRVNFQFEYDRLWKPGAEVRLLLRGMASAPAVGEDDMAYRSVKRALTGVAPGLAVSAPALVSRPAAPEEKKAATPGPAAAPRKNFSETAFFFPDLHPDSTGSVVLNFTMPEALTRWRWLMLAHTKELAFGYDESSVLTQKELMVLPNLPRFLRAGDTMRLPVKISNLTDTVMRGTASLAFLDPETNASLDAAFSNGSARQPFTAEAGGGAVLYFPVVLPAHFERPVVYRIVAEQTGGARSDGEEGLLPVLGDRTLVTESLPLYNTGAGEKKYRFENLLKKGASAEPFALTVEYSANPAWYAVQALPYLIEFPHECAEQTFERFYANALSAKITGSVPGLAAVFDRWRTDSSALQSNLEKNPELKSALLRETPWLTDAKTEKMQKRQLAKLLQADTVSLALQNALAKLASMQAESGGFPWFAGGREDLYITQYLLTGLGRLQKLEAIPGALRAQTDAMATRALAYADRQLADDMKSIDPKKDPDALWPTWVQYIYLRSFFPGNAAPAAAKAATFVRRQAARLWTTQPVQLQAMIALALFRAGDTRKPAEILASLKERAENSDELGLRWPRPSSWFWQESPVETQALALEAFEEIGRDTTAVADLKRGLLAQKRTQNWPTTKATADACYALLLRGGAWLKSTPAVSIRLGAGKQVVSEPGDEAATGYLKRRIPAAEIVPSMGNITVNVANTGAPVPGYGAVYWQYFEDYDKIRPAQTPLTLGKEVFVQVNSGKGPVLQPVDGKHPLQVGDRVITRLVLRCDRDMDYLHLKDVRAACFEPVDVLSEYKYQDGLGYYQTTNDASSDFFFDHIRPGTYVFEYAATVTAAGRYGNGIASIDCMYAPEFSAHSAGSRIFVAEP